MGSKENRVEQRLIDGVKALGGRTFKFVSPGLAGVPDRIVILPGGKPSRIQLRRIAQLRNLDVTALVLTGIDEVEHYLDNLRELMNE